MPRNRETKRIYNAMYLQSHRDELLKRKKAWYQANRARLLPMLAERRANNLEVYQARSLAYDSKNREKRRQAAIQRLRDHPERAAQYRKTHSAVIAQYRQSHRAEMREYQKRYKARKRNAQICDFTHTEWLEMQEHYKHRCAYCDKRAKGKLTQDHITPLSKGGNHTKSNIVPACRSCNCRKHAGPPLKPIQPLLL